MNNRNLKISIIVILSLLTSFAFSQNICFKVDSVSVFYIPWQCHPRFPLSKGNIIFEDHHYKVFTDSAIIADLLTSQLYYKEWNDSREIDVRMVIRIHFKTHNLDIALDDIGFFEFEGSKFYRNKELVNWINKNVTPME